MRPTRIAGGLAILLALPALGQTSPDAERSYAADLLADAGTRTSTLGAAADPVVKTGGYIVFRYNVNSRDDVPGAEDTTVGFHLAKTKVNVSGSISDELSYYVLLSASQSTGAVSLQDAHVTWKLDDTWKLKWGQFKLPLLREETTSDTRGLAAERSVMNAEFTQSRSQAVQLSTEGESFRFLAAFSDGLGTLNTDFTSMAEADWAVTARGEYMWAGEWSRFNDFTSWRGSDFAGMAGVAGHYQTGGDTFATSDMDLWELTADASVEGDGWNAFVAGVWRHTDPVGGGMDIDDFGLLAQAGVFVSETWEVFVRWDTVFADDNNPPISIPPFVPPDDFSTITAGFNHYILPESHAAKLTFDVQYFLDGQAASIVSPSTLTGVLADGSDGQWTARLQFQLVF